MSNDDAPVTTRLSSVVQELQEIRQQDEIDYRHARRLRSATTDVQKVRNSMQSKLTHNEQEDSNGGE